MTLINHGLRISQPDIGSVEATCNYCSNIFHEDDIVNATDGDEVFCSENCRDTYEQDRAADRAEMRNDLY